jgi:perosamine synthetase
MKKDYETENIIRPWACYIAPETADEVKKVLDSTWINTGKKEKEFREKVCEMFDADYAIACNSGTAGLKAIYKSLKIGPGDEVVTTPYSFIATNTAILEVGATPVFADIKYDTLNIDPASIIKKITKKTKAINCVHFGGIPIDLDEIRKIGAEFNLPIIEDSAHAMGSKYKGKYIGAECDFTMFSFQVVKIVTCGDGSIVCTSNEEYYKNLKKLIWYGVDREEKRTNPLDPLPEDITELGFKMNMNDITATIGCVAMDHLQEQLTLRKYIGNRYIKEFSNLKRIKLLKYSDDVDANFQLFPVHVEDRSKFANYMFERGIQVNVNNRRNDKYSIFGGVRKDLVNTKKCDEDVILLPMHTELTKDNIEKIITTVKQYDYVS